jgi:hypothetical protein
MPAVDLDSLRAARAEQRAKDGVEPNSIRVGGREFVLQAELPVAAIEAISRLDLNDGLTALLENSDEVPDLLAAKLTIEDVAAIVEKVFGETLGNLSA